MKCPQTDAAIHEARWLALQAGRLGEVADFVYAIRGRGIYRRPGDVARLPLRRNVLFFDSAELAEAAGFRAAASARSAPNETQCVARACRQIEQAEIAPALDALAEQAGMSVWRFHRLFRRITGLTPKAYTQACRAQRLRQALEEGAAVTDALYAAGYGSSSRLYEGARGLLGMRPGEYRAGGVGQRVRFAVAQCRLGAVLVACSEVGVCAILLGDDPEPLVQQLQRRFAQAELVGADVEFERWIAQVLGMLESPATGLQLPLDIRGSAFQQRVWQALREIAPGSTASYQEIARRIGAPTAHRAVAQACASNWLAVAIPCHRVVRADGGLSGYRWGVERKRELLALEGASAAECTPAHAGLPCRPLLVGRARRCQP